MILKSLSQESSGNPQAIPWEYSGNHSGDPLGILRESSGIPQKILRLFSVSPPVLFWSNSVDKIDERKKNWHPTLSLWENWIFLSKLTSGAQIKDWYYVAQRLLFVKFITYIPQTENRVHPIKLLFLLWRYGPFKHSQITTRLKCDLKYFIWLLWNLFLCLIYPYPNNESDLVNLIYSTYGNWYEL